MEEFIGALLSLGFVKSTERGGKNWYEKKDIKTGKHTLFVFVGDRMVDVLIKYHDTIKDEIIAHRYVISNEKQLEFLVKNSSRAFKFFDNL